MIAQCEIGDITLDNEIKTKLWTAHWVLLEEESLKSWCNYIPTRRGSGAEITSRVMDKLKPIFEKTTALLSYSCTLLILNQWINPHYQRWNIDQALSLPLLLWIFSPLSCSCPLSSFQRWGVSGVSDFCPVSPLIVLAAFRLFWP